MNVKWIEVTAMSEQLKLLGPTAASHEQGGFLREFSEMVQNLSLADPDTDLKHQMKVSQHQALLASAHYMFSLGQADQALETAAAVLLSLEAMKGTLRGNLLAAEATLLIAQCRITSTLK